LSGFQQIFGRTNLNDFYAFANSSGGHIILGIGENKNNNNNFSKAQKYYLLLLFLFLFFFSTPNL
jgi:hypothetical protein